MRNRRLIATATLCLGMGIAMGGHAQQTTPAQPTDENGQVTNPQPHTDREYKQEKKREKKELKHNKKSDEAATKAAKHQDKAMREADKSQKEADKANQAAQQPQ